MKPTKVGFSTRVHPLINTKKNVLSDFCSRQSDVLCEYDNVMSLTEEDSLFEIYKACHVKWGHPGVKRLTLLLQYLGASSVSKSLTKRVLKECAFCEKNKRAAAANTVAKIPILDKPNQELSIDHFDPFSQTDHFRNRYVFSIRDRFSKLSAIFPCKSHNHSEVANHLRNYIQINGPVEAIRLDNFFRNSEPIESFAKENNIQLIFPPVYRACANPVERIHRQLRELLPNLRKVMQPKITNFAWSKLLPIAANILNTVPHSTTGFAPYHLHHGYMSADLFEERTARELRQMWREAKKNMEKRQTQNLKRGDVPIRNLDFEPNDQIYADLPKQGMVEAVIVEDYGDTCLIDKGDGAGERFRFGVVHKSRIARRIQEKKPILC